VDEAIKLMWHNKIGQFRRIFLESWFTSHQNNDLNSYDPEQCCIVLLCETFI